MSTSLSIYRAVLRVTQLGLSVMVGLLLSESDLFAGDLISEMNKDRPIALWRTEDNQNIKTSFAIKTPANEWSIELWVKYSGFEMQPCGIDKCSASAVFCPKSGRVFTLGKDLITITLDGYEQQFVFTAPGLEVRAPLAASGMENTLHQFTMVSARTGMVSIYFDGVLVKEQKTKFTPNFLAPEDVNLGNLDAAIQGLSIKALALYNRPLEVALIRKHAESGRILIKKNRR